MSKKIGNKDDVLQSMFQFSIDQATLAVFWMNRDAGFTYVNEQACRSLGYTREELMSLHLWDIDPIYKKALWEEIWENSIKGGAVDTFHIETLHRRKDGSTIPIEVDAKHFWFGETEFHIAYTRDITERKREEKTLRKYEQIVSSSTDLMSFMDNNYVYQAVNKSYLSTFRKRRDQIVRHSIADLLGEEAFKNNIKPKLDQCLKGKRVRFQHWLEVPGGALRFWDVRYDPLYEADGSISGIGIVVRDITDQRRAEDALRQAKEFSENLIQTANVMILSLDQNGNIDIFNQSAEKITGYTQLKMKGKNWFEIFVPKDRYAYVWEEFNRLLAGGMPKTFENPILTKSGEERYIIWQNNPVKVDGKVVSTISFGNDITERKRAEEEKAKLELQLLQAQKMESIGRLAGGVAHDFNNMLSVILGYAELIRSKIAMDDPILKDLSEIEKAATRSKNTTQQLLAFSKKQIVLAKPVDLNDRIEDTKKTLARLIGEDIDLRFYPHKALWKIKFDNSQIDQIIINLAVNARDAMPSGGNLIIKTNNIRLDEADCRKHLVKPGDYVELFAKDSGDGMDKDTLSHIFEPFFTTKTLDKGTGLGLAMVYGVVKQCGGFIDVDSQLKHGTTFKVYFPRYDEEEAIRENHVETPLSSATGTILLVEDDELVRNMVKAMLNKIDYNVLVAKLPKDALSICERSDKSIDLLLTDVVMPEMTGIDLENRMRSILPSAKVLFMSGYTEEVIVVKGIQNKNVHFIQKPFNVNTLARKLSDVIAS